MDGDTDDLADELRALERRRLAALVDVDLATAELLHTVDYQLVTPGGDALSRSDYLGSLADGTLVYQRFEPDGDVAVRLLGPSAAALRYVAAIDATFPGGHDVDRFWHTDIYEQRDGRWQAAWSQATRIR
jgi:hypothetical protein